MDEKHVADYFIISGVSENQEKNSESKSLINSVLPITDVVVIFKGLGEKCPDGYTCIETTPGNHPADLNHGNFSSQNIKICYRRGDDKPPLVEIGVYYEGKDRVLPDVEVVYLTPYGHCASTASSSKHGTFITYRRARTRRPYNQLVVVDLCVILNNKSEHPPHAFYSTKKNLNKSYYGMIGSEVFLCYKKTLLSPPSLSFEPQIISRFPLQDYANFPLPDTMPLFCLPAGASIELRPASIPLPRPITSTFVLTSDSAQKIYGTSLSFYEPFDESLLTKDQKHRLGLIEPLNVEIDDHEDRNNHNQTQQTFVIKSICILSRWPFFECFEKFLLFLHKLVFNPNYSNDNPGSPFHKKRVPLEHHISHFLLDVSFPTPQRPTVLVQLMPGTDEEVSISQPSNRLPLPLTGASFIQLLTMLGVENTMNVLLFGLCEQKILLHSLNSWVLTGVAEAITAMLFPFHWQCPYVPSCPLSLHGILNAPLPFIVGIDSRCFDTFTPPDDIICIDLDTQSIYLSELKKCLNLRILPKRAARVLKSSLEKIFQRCLRIQSLSANQSPQNRSALLEAQKQQIDKKIELEIQEAFVRFMATILRGFRSYLLPITRAPTAGATDPTSLFDFEGFLGSRDRNYNQFYQLITKTQMFTHYIEERSFVSDKNTSLAFFDDCEERLISSDDIFSDRPIKLFDKDDGLVQTDRSVYIPAPEQSPSVSLNNSSAASNEHHKLPNRRCKFGPLNPTLFHRHPCNDNFLSLERAMNSSMGAIENKLLADNHTNEQNSSFSISRRTKPEVRTSQKMAKKSAETPLNWSKYLVSCCYCLWFSTLPSYIAYCKMTHVSDTATSNQDDCETKSIARILRYAHSTIVKMQKLQLTTDEICFRVLTLLCGHYGQPALAVRVFFEMKKAGIKPNAVTYGYYNKAVLESKWPDHSSKPTTVLWTKIRNVISGIALFKSHGRLRMERCNTRCIQLIGDPNFYRADTDVVDRAFIDDNISSGLFKPTTVPIDRDYDGHDASSYSRGHQRRSLINRSFSTFQKGSTDSGNDFDAESSGLSHTRNSIQKSYSMHLRNGSPDRSNTLNRVKSPSVDIDDEPAITQRSIRPIDGSMISTKKITSTHDLFFQMREKHQLFKDPDSGGSLNANLNLIDNMAGLLFTTNPDSHRLILTRANSLSPLLLDHKGVAPTNKVDESFLLNNSDLPSSGQQNHITDANEFLKTNIFGEDAQILSKIESREQKPDFSDSFLAENKSSTSDETRSNQLSESHTEGDQNTQQDEDQASLLGSLAPTPNFKLASLINDASNLQWSKWTSSQNSKSVYKGIKSAATGIVSSLQEMKSSFSISSSNTPSKLLTQAQHKSTATREMLSQWANYFTSQSQRGYGDEDDFSDSSSLGSNDLFKLSNEEDSEQSAAEASEYRFCHRLFEALDRHYSNSGSKEDLIDHLTASLAGNSKPADDSDKDQIAIKVTLTTCSRCNVCHSLLYDEEIMERWSYNESNLNTRCIYCRAKIVPLMNITVDDRRFLSREAHKRSDRRDTSDDLVDLNFDSDNSEDPDKRTRHYDDIRTACDNQMRFTVPYLSPIVLRKELESVFESSGDSCSASSRFVDEHPIIFWNLLWYFTRINVPTHLALLCLEAKSILNGREVPAELKSSNNKVVVRTLWDNDKLHSGIGRPLYRQLERGNPSMRVEAILCDEIHFRRTFLERVINLMKANQLQKAMSLVLNARLRSSAKFSFDKNRHNLYRDLIFLIHRDLGPDKLYMDNFEREYKRAFEGLNFQQVSLNRFDRPPTIGSLFCRKSFKKLSLDL